MNRQESRRVLSKIASAHYDHLYKLAEDKKGNLLGFPGEALERIWDKTLKRPLTQGAQALGVEGVGLIGRALPNDEWRKNYLEMLGVLGATPEVQWKVKGEGYTRDQYNEDLKAAVGKTEKALLAKKQNKQPLSKAEEAFLASPSVKTLPAEIKQQVLDNSVLLTREERRRRQAEGTAVALGEKKHAIDKEYNWNPALGKRKNLKGMVRHAVGQAVGGAMLWGGELYFGNDTKKAEAEINRIQANGLWTSAEKSKRVAAVKDRYRQQTKDKLKYAPYWMLTDDRLSEMGLNPKWLWADQKAKKEYLDEIHAAQRSVASDNGLPPPKATPKPADTQPEDVTKDGSEGEGESKTDNGGGYAFNDPAYTSNVAGNPGVKPMSATSYPGAGETDKLLANYTAGGGNNAAVADNTADSKTMAKDPVTEAPRAPRVRQVRRSDMGLTARNAATDAFSAVKKFPSAFYN